MITVIYSQDLRNGAIMSNESYDPNGWWMKWYDDDQFNGIWEQVREVSLLTAPRLYTLYEFARGTCKLPGDTAELGVYVGGTAKLIAKVCASKKVHLFDTFEGLPQPHHMHDFMKKGDLKATYDQAKEFLSDVKNVEFHKGFFPTTTAGLEDRTFSFVHMDGDLYQTTKDACEFFYPRMVPGGVILFDDYGFIQTDGVRTAVDEYFRDKVECPIYLTSYTCVLIKAGG
jgi:hypothetical protein